MQFINRILKEDRVTTGHYLESCTKEMNLVQIDTSDFLRQFPWLQHRRLFLVDTPGFDDASTSELAILNKIDEWLIKS